MRAIALAALAAAATLSFAGAGRALAASGEDIALHGTPNGTACVMCHGKTGEGNADAGFPRLAGLNAAYISHELASFADGTRKNDVMGPIAQALTEADRKAVAAYFAGLAPPLPKAAAAPTPEIALGYALATRGDWSKKLPACSQCHGATGLGVGEVFPPLEGQSATLYRQRTQRVEGRHAA
jgi:cytochrome c553